MQQLQIPPLAEGERYIGAIGDADGSLYRLILLPGDNDDATWQEQMDWAKSIGGDLPNKIELAMLWNTCRSEFQTDWYWSNQPHELEPSSAWFQFFNYGGQSATPLGCAAARPGCPQIAHSVIHSFRRGNYAKRHS